MHSKQSKAKKKKNGRKSAVTSLLVELIFFFFLLFFSQNKNDSKNKKESGTHRVLNGERFVGLVRGDRDFEGNGRPFLDRLSHHLGQQPHNVPTRIGRMQRTLHATASHQMPDISIVAHFLIVVDCARDPSDGLDTTGVNITVRRRSRHLVKTKTPQENSNRHHPSTNRSTCCTPSRQHYIARDAPLYRPPIRLRRAGQVMSTTIVPITREYSVKEKISSYRTTYCNCKLSFFIAPRHVSERAVCLLALVPLEHCTCRCLSFSMASEALEMSSLRKTSLSV